MHIQLLPPMRRSTEWGDVIDITRTDRSVVVCWPDGVHVHSATTTRPVLPAEPPVTRLDILVKVHNGAHSIHLFTMAEQELIDELVISDFLFDTDRGVELTGKGRRVIAFELARYRQQAAA